MQLIAGSVCFVCGAAEGEAAHQEGAMEPPEDNDGRTFVEVISEKYSPENFPYRRGPGMGVVVVSTGGPQGSPMKGEPRRTTGQLKRLTGPFVTF